MRRILRRVQKQKCNFNNMSQSNQSNVNTNKMTQQEQFVCHRQEDGGKRRRGYQPSQLFSKG